MARNRSHANRAAQPLSHRPTGSDLGRRRHHRALPPTKVPFGKKALLKVAFIKGRMNGIPKTYTSRTVCPLRISVYDMGNSGSMGNTLGVLEQCWSICL